MDNNLDYQYFGLMVFPGLRIIRSEETRTARIYLWNNGIVCQVYKKHAVVEGEDILENVEAFKQITDGIPLPFIFIPEEDVTITRDAREVGSLSEKTSSPVKVAALIAPNMAYKLLADFYMRFHKPKMTYKVMTKLTQETIDFLLPYVPEEFDEKLFDNKRTEAQ